LCPNPIDRKKTLLKTIDNAVREFRAPRTMTPEELGDSLARLVWESFSDFVAESEPELTLTDLLAASGDGVPEDHAAEEALVFFLWAHTRGTQLAFIGRASDDLVRRGLDIMHKAVFDDMVVSSRTPAWAGRSSGTSPDARKCRSPPSEPWWSAPSRSPTRSGTSSKTSS
jgi:hypothetical protein